METPIADNSSVILAATARVAAEITHVALTIDQGAVFEHGAHQRHELVVLTETRTTAAHLRRLGDRMRRLGAAKIRRIGCRRCVISLARPAR